MSLAVFSKDWSRDTSHRGDQHIASLEVDILVESALRNTYLRGYDGGRLAVVHTLNGVLESCIGVFSAVRHLICAMYTVQRQ